MEKHSVTLSFNPAQCTIKTQQGSDMVLHQQKAEDNRYPDSNAPLVENLAAGNRYPDPSNHGSRSRQSLLENEMSVNMAARLLKRQYKSSFVALIKPVEITPPDIAGAMSMEGPSTNPPDTIMGHQGLKDLINEFTDCFSESPQGGGADIPDLEHTIDIIPGSKPPYRHNKRLSPLELAELKKQVLEFLEKGIITPSNSPYGAPVLFIPKPSGGLRFCLDYRARNEITVNETPVPTTPN